jgi:hypothetical protein
VRATRAARENRYVPWTQRLLAIGPTQRRVARQDEEPLLLGDMPVIRADPFALAELIDGAAPSERAEPRAELELARRIALTIVARPELRVEEIGAQKPGPSGAGSGLVGSPGRAPPSLYSDGATSFGPSG